MFLVEVEDSIQNIENFSQNMNKALLQADKKQTPTSSNRFKQVTKEYVDEKGKKSIQRNATNITLNWDLNIACPPVSNWSIQTLISGGDSRCSWVFICALNPRRGG